MTVRVLYIENGMHGGGSAESLVQLLGVIDRQHVEPRVLLTSSIPVSQRLKQMGVPCEIFHDLCYTKPNDAWQTMWFTLCNGLVAHASRRLPAVLLVFERLVTGSLRQRLQMLLRESQIDLVHTNNNVYRDFWAIEAAARAGVACVSHLRSFHAMGFNRRKAALVNACVEGFIGYSQSILEFWEGQGLDPAKFHLIPNAIGEVQVEPADVRGDLGLPRDAQVIGIVGRVIPERGHELLLRALPAVIERLPNLRLLVVGGFDEGDRRRLGALAASLGIERAVHWLGHQCNGRGIIAALDAIVLPYTIEPFGRTVLEAWRLGTPVVLSRVGHIEQIVTHEQDALLFDPSDPADLAEQLMRLLTKAALADRLTKKGSQVCEERFSVTAQARSIETLYATVLAAH